MISSLSIFHHGPGRGSIHHQAGWLTHRRILALVLVLWLLALLAGAAYAAITTAAIPRYALLPGGLSQGGDSTLQQVSGQPCGFESRGGKFSLQGGLLPETAVYRRYMPVMNK